MIGGEEEEGVGAGKRGWRCVNLIWAIRLSLSVPRAVWALPRHPSLAWGAATTTIAPPQCVLHSRWGRVQQSTPPPHTHQTHCSIGPEPGFLCFSNVMLVTVPIHVLAQQQCSTGTETFTASDTPVGKPVARLIVLITTVLHSLFEDDSGSC